MTRTARAAYPRAVIKDRSESRTGLDSSIRKSGAGYHNWGSLADELHLEAAAIDDESFEEREIETPLSASLTGSSSTGCKRALFITSENPHLFVQLFRLRLNLRTSGSPPKRRWRRPVTSGRTPSRLMVHNFSSSPIYHNYN